MTRVIPRIRPERTGDEDGIRALTEAAFRGRWYAGGDEQKVVDRLRRAGALVISLVAEIDDVDETLVGQISFSPATAPDGSPHWYALGPVSVRPEHQGRGIGAALVRRGLEDLSARGADGCVLTGDPAYYRRFGFELAPENVPAGESAEYFQLRSFGRDVPVGPFAFHPAFFDPGPETGPT